MGFLESMDDYDFWLKMWQGSVLVLFLFLAFLVLRAEKLCSHKCVGGEGSLSGCVAHDPSDPSLFLMIYGLKTMSFVSSVESKEP